MAVNNLITLRKGIATEWSSQNPTLASGEPGYDGTNNVLKIGDGATAWNDLDPIALSSVNEDGSPILGGELNLDNNDIVIDCRNETGSTIAAGTPVYVSGYYSNNGKPLIAPADASDTSKMPAFGILNDALNTDTEGTMGIMGVVSHVNTAGFDVGDVVYVASGGGYTNIKPILEDNLIQNLGRVLRVDASQGRILLLGAGRSNDIPNLDEGKIWVGSSGNTITSSTIHINETNNRVGIGTNTPQTEIDISGNLTALTGNIDTLSFNINTEPLLLKGQVAWNDTEGTLDIGLNGGGHQMAVGESRFFRVRNETDSPLYKGQVVYATGVHSNGIITPAKFIANGTINEIRFIGIVFYDISINNNGYVVDFGQVRDLDLDGSVSNYAVGDETWVAGDILYAHPTVAGKLTKVEPKDAISVAIVLDTGNGNGNGKMFVRPTNFGHLSDNHDVNVSGLLNNQFLVYDSGTDYWQPSSGLYYVDGDLGIGTASPQAKLDVNGTVQFDDLVRWEYPDKILDTNIGTLGYLRPYDEAGAYCGLGVSASSFNIGASGAINTRFIGQGVERAIFDTNGNFIFNDNGNNCDFRIEGDTDQNLFFCDASSDNIGIGTTTLPYKLNVNGDIGLTDSGFYASPTGVMVGTSGWLYNDGQTTLSHGNFTDNGDAQNSSYVLRTSTTNDTFTTIANNGSSIRLSNNRTFMFTANIVARRTNGQDNAAYKLEGIIANDGYGASILGTPVKTILYESDSSWDVQAIIVSINIDSDTSDDLLIQGKGAASKNINWVCKLDLLEVGGDISGYTESNALGIQENIIP